MLSTTFFLPSMWSLVAAHLPGRSDNEIKNHWNSRLRRKICSFAKSTSDWIPYAMNAANLVGAASEPKGGKSICSAMKNPITTLISLEKAKKPTFPDAVLKTNRKRHWSNRGTQIMGSVSGGPKVHEAEETTNPDVQGSWVCTQEIISKERGDSAEGFGPYEWLDVEIKRLKYALHGEIGGPSGSDTQQHGLVVGTSEERQNWVMGPDRKATSDQESVTSSFWSPKETEGRQDCFLQPNYSKVGEEWLDREWMGGGDHTRSGES